MTTTLVLGYDGSDCAQLALDRTAELVRDLPGATVLVVYAFEFSIGYVPTGMADSPLMMSAGACSVTDASACTPSAARSTW